MTEEKKKYRKLDADDPRLTLAVLLYRYMGSEEACLKAGLPTDESTRRKVGALNPRYARRKLPLELEPISHVTLIADGWEPDYDQMVILYSKGANDIVLQGDHVVIIYNEGMDEVDVFALTIGELKEALKSLT